MSAILILFVSVLFFSFGYFVYARSLEKLFSIEPKNKTPAYTKFDGIDFVPAKKPLILFGHHFSSIAGAGPIVGPVLACSLWGWGTSLVWVVIGSVLIGGLHDFGSLFLSVRSNGQSIADISKEIISKKAKIIFSLFIWLALILVIAVFTYLCAETFVRSPEIVIPSLGLIPIAMLTGILIYNLKFNFALSTIIGLGLSVISIFLGQMLPIDLGVNSIIIWSIVLLVYCFLASVIPVNILLQPRDYLSSYFLFAGIALGIAGIIFKNPTLSSATFCNINSNNLTPWPMLCVIIACGAVSGFHSLVASGTSSKQIANEKDIRLIGYGAMAVEGLLAVVAIIAVSCGISSSNYSKGSEIEFFADGYNYITSFFLGGYGKFAAIFILNAFILTTLDTATRINRYITEELFYIKNRYLSTFIVIVLSGIMVFSGNWKKIWPVFGASNQLIAAFALIVISAWLLSKKKKFLFALLPAFFMLITSLTALVIQITNFLKQDNFLLASICLGLICLALVMVVDSIFILLRRKNV